MTADPNRGIRLVLSEHPSHGATGVVVELEWNAFTEEPYVGQPMRILPLLGTTWRYTVREIELHGNFEHHLHRTILEALEGASALRFVCCSAESLSRILQIPSHLRKIEFRYCELPQDLGKYWIDRILISGCSRRVSTSLFEVQAGAVSIELPLVDGVADAALISTTQLFIDGLLGNAFDDAARLVRYCDRQLQSVYLQDMTLGPSTLEAIYKSSARRVTSTGCLWDLRRKVKVPIPENSAIEFADFDVLAIPAPVLAAAVRAAHGIRRLVMPKLELNDSLCRAIADNHALASVDIMRCSLPAEIHGVIARQVVELTISQAQTTRSQLLKKTFPNAQLVLVDLLPDG